MDKRVCYDVHFMTVYEFMKWARIGRTKTYEEIKAGRLEAVKVGRKTLIPTRSASAWAESHQRLPWRTDGEVFGKGPPDGP